jgi:putative salt-induced outer membrane protein YdiY
MCAQLYPAAGLPRPKPWRRRARFVHFAGRMSESFRRFVSVFAIVVLSGSGRAAAQTPANPPPEPPPPLWTGSAGLGLSLNRGNTATTNFNASFDATRDPKTRSVWKLKGLYQRGTTNGTLAVDRLLFEGRNERTLSDRIYAFGQLQFLQDEFKAIDYLVAPGGGIGYKLVATPVTSFNETPDRRRRHRVRQARAQAVEDRRDHAELRRAVEGQGFRRRAVYVHRGSGGVADHADSVED